MHWYDHMNWGWGGGLMMIVWVVLIAAVIYWLIVPQTVTVISRQAQPESQWIS